MKAILDQIALLKYDSRPGIFRLRVSSSIAKRVNFVIQKSYLLFYTSTHWNPIDKGEPAPHGQIPGLVPHGMTRALWNRNTSASPHIGRFTSP